MANIRVLKSKNVKQNGQKARLSLLSRIAIVAMVLQLITPAGFILPVVKAAVSPAPVWPTSWTTPNTCLSDPSDESPTEADILGDSTNPAVGFAYDSNFQYFRERIEGNPGAVTNLKNSAWVVLFQSTTPQYQYLGSVNGDDNKVQLWQNTPPSGSIDFNPVFHDAAEVKLWEGNSTDYARVTTSGSNYHIDWAIPITELASRGITTSVTKYFATSQTSSNYNKDYLNCYQAIADLSVTKTGNSSLVDIGDSLTYTISVSNGGPESASSVVVSDVLPVNVSFVSSSTATGSYNSGTGVWAVGTLASGASATLSITVTIVSGSSVTNTASISSTTIDSNNTNNSSSVTTTVNSPQTEDTVPLCSDEQDNDDDDLVDLADPDCAPFMPSLTVNKVLVNDNGGTQTSFTLYINDGTVTSGTANDVIPGTYTVSEGAHAGYTSTISGDCSDAGSVTLAINEHKSCTITNNDIQATLTVNKVVINNDGGNATVSSFPLFVNATSVTSGVSTGFNAGVYTVSETNLSGYSATYSGDCNGSGSVTLAINENKTCTVTNDDVAPTVKINKTVVNNNGGTAVENDFSFSLNDVIELFHNVATSVTAGSHMVSEGTFFGYDTSVWSGDCAADGSITLVPGQNATCNITNNDQPATLMVYKTVINEEGGDLQAVASDFTLSVTGSGVSPASFTGDTDGTEVTLNAGSYSVTEGGYENYSTTYSGDCEGSIDVGETKSCYVYNTSYEVTMGRIVVDKVTTPEADSQTFGFSLTGTNGFSLTDASDPYDSGFIEPGIYTLSETELDGWVLNGISCSDESSASSISVSAGETVVCTVTNTKLGTLVIEKITLGGDEIFSFNTTGPGLPNFSITTIDGFGSETYSELMLGTKSVTEGSLPAGWLLTGLICTDPDGGTTVNLLNKTATVDLDAGETVTCTFTNTKLGSITIEKVTSPSEAEQTFSFDASYYDGTFNLGDGGSNESDLLEPGNYTVTENSTEGWILTNILCSDPDDGSEVDGSTAYIDLDAGEHITCMFTNILEEIAQDVTPPVSAFDNNRSHEIINTEIVALALTGTSTDDVGPISDPKSGVASAAMTIYSIPNILGDSGLNGEAWETLNCMQMPEAAVEVEMVALSLSSVGALDVTWSHNWTPASRGVYCHVVHATDVAGNVENTAIAGPIAYTYIAPPTPPSGGGGGGGGGGAPTCSIDATTVSVTIVGGEGSANVTLNFTYPSSVDSFSVSNDASFAGASFEPVVGSKSWTLNSSSGPRTVYVRFHAIGGCTLDKSSTVGQVLGVQAPAPRVLGVQTCSEYLFKYIRFGRSNDINEVKKLQTFLNEFMKENLTVDGVYNKATMEAVNRFQLAYKNEVLKPWVRHGLKSENTSTGYVYKTTKRWINMIKCSSLNLPVPKLP